jgi:hypothetical protein
MRAILLVFCASLLAPAAVVSRDWNDGKLTLKLDDGAAELEWISPVSFRFARSWTADVPALPKIKREKVTPVFDEVGSTVTMKTRYLTVELDRGDLHLHMKSGGDSVTDTTLVRTGDEVELRLAFTQDERVYGLMGAGTKLNLRGEKLERRQGFFFTNSGYGVYVRSPERCVFDMANATVLVAGASSIEYLFYYGPTAKEVLEQHATFNPTPEVDAERLDLLAADRLPKQVSPLPDGAVRTWDALASLVRTMNQWSLSGVTYPALNLSIFDHAPEEIKRRATDLSTLFPIVYRSAGEGGVDVATRKAWTPYLMTYLREAFDRGYPLIRPLPMQFSKDKHVSEQTDVFMLGDEVLLAPMAGPGGKRRVELPRGLWTDFRSNTEYRGGQTVEVDAPAGRVPMFVRNGWIVPLAADGKMELHYFPSLGGEFFLWEADLSENSQFHAAPAGDYVRVEVESQKHRTYEWILHHTKAPREVAEEAGAYQKVEQRSALKAGTWWHDAAQNNLHLMLEAKSGSDRIVNISF